MPTDISKSLFYRVLKAEHEEIDRLKWLESQKVGFDIGIDHARWLWMIHHQDKWMKAIMISGKKKF